MCAQNLDDTLTREFKENLRKILESRAAETNPKKLSLAAGLGETAIRDILQNRAQSPKLETVHKIAHALDLTAGDLMPSLLGETYAQIEGLRAENQALREALGNSFTSRDDALNKIKKK